MLINLCFFIHIQSIRREESIRIEQHEWYFETINLIVSFSCLKTFLLVAHCTYLALKLLSGLQGL